MHLIVKMLFFFLTIWGTLQNENSMWIHNNYMKESMLNMFLCSYFEYFQIWLNICMDDEHFSNITKLSPPKNKKKTTIDEVAVQKTPNCKFKGTRSNI